MKEKIIGSIRAFLNPILWKDKLIGFIRSIPAMFRQIYLFGLFFVLLTTYLLTQLNHFFLRVPLLKVLIGKINAIWERSLNVPYSKLISKIESSGTSVNRSYLIQLAYKNLVAKKTRSFITILGMSVGVGIIVFLLSLGYGIERLIISRVASLDELKMIDVSAGENTTLRLSDQILKKIEKITSVDKAIPLVSVVGRINYQKATTDVLVYAAPKSYLQISKLKLLKGKLFTNSLEYAASKKISQKELENGMVAGAMTELRDGTFGAVISSGSVYFNVNPDTVPAVWDMCSVSGKNLGVTIRSEGGYIGEEVWGSEYYPFTRGGREGYDQVLKSYLGKWIRAKMPIFSKTPEGSVSPKLDVTGRQLWETVCMTEKDASVIERLSFAQVLGESTESASLAASESADLTTPSSSDSAGLSEATVVASSSGGLELVSVSGSASASVKKTQEKLVFSEKPDGEAVASLGLLNLLNLTPEKAIGQSFKVQFIIVKSLMPEIEGKALTQDVEYKIVGVIDDPETTYFYIPYSDIAKIAIKNFSQIKIIVNDNNALPTVRKHVETLGFRTSSTVDTVKQIESLFNNLRIVLAILGLVALGVASLGMFNTLTVSLLERTREIGGMKTMGVVSEEIQDLFLAEAMIMGLSGGIGGLVIGSAGGKILSFLVSIIAISHGQGYLELSYIPLYFTVFILVSSFVVGVLTGLYPVQRAKRISALNALRYE